MLKLILHNIFKHKALFILVGLIVMLLAFYLLVGMNTSFSITNSLVSALEENMTGHLVIVPAEREGIDLITGRGETAASISGWQEVLAFIRERAYTGQAAPRLRVKARLRSLHNHMPLFLVGVDPAAEKNLLPGRVLDSGRWLSGPGEVNMYYRHSDTLSIEDGEAVGISSTTAAGYSRFDRAQLTGRFDFQGLDYYNEYVVCAYVTLDYLWEILMLEDKMISEIFVRLKDRGYREELIADLTGKFGPAFTFILPQETSSLVNGIYQLTRFVISLVSILIIIMVFLCSSYIVALAIETRRREIGIYQAIGVHKYRIGLLFGGEFILVMVFFALLGTAAALVFVNYLGSGGIRATIVPLHLVFGKPVLFIQNYWAGLIYVWLILAVSFIGNAAYGILRMSSLKPVQLIREV